MGSVFLSFKALEYVPFFAMNTMVNFDLLGLLVASFSTWAANEHGQPTALDRLRRHQLILLSDI